LVIFKTYFKTPPFQQQSQVRVPNASRKQSTVNIEHHLANKHQYINNKLSNPSEPDNDNVKKWQQLNSKINSKTPYQSNNDIGSKFQQTNNKFSSQIPPIIETNPSPPGIHPQALNKIQKLVDKFKFDSTPQEPIPLKSETNKIQPKVQVC